MSARPAKPTPENGAKGGDDGEDATEAARAARRQSQRMLADSVNTRVSGASNHTKEDRAREAEEDRALITKAQAGDRAAFRKLVERHQRRAFAIALHLVRDENDARELVQDAFLRVYKSLPSFQGGSSFFTWLYRIITNLSIDLIRKPGRKAQDLDDARFDSDDANEAISEHANVEVVYPDQSELGTLLMPTTVVLIRGAAHVDPGRKLIDYLLCAEVTA